MMQIRVAVEPASSHNEFADCFLATRRGAEWVRQARLDVDYRPVMSVSGRVTAIADDVLLLAASVYGVDKLVERSRSDDAWTRQLSVRIPVSDPGVWGGSAEPLGEVVSFLTGDIWDFEFVRRRETLVRPSPKRVDLNGRLNDIDAISLFSGGLDSLIGVIDWLESNRGRILLVGHHDGDVSGPLADQKALLAPLLLHYPGRVEQVLTRFGTTPSAPEISFRGRSLMFLGLAIHVAAGARPGTQVLIPENGNIALNVPLTPSRQGSCSTRTAHPHYLQSLQAVLQSVGIDTPIVNPLSDRTKGESVRACRNQHLLRDLYALSASCAKRGHSSTWIRKSARQCGRCMPCLYRRAALHAGAMDDEVYGNDVCRGEVPVIDHVGSGMEPTGAADVRAMLGFIRRRTSDREIARRLVVNGRITTADIAAATNLVQRAMGEVRQLLEDKGTPEVKRAAGIDRDHAQV